MAGLDFLNNLAGMMQPKAPSGVQAYKPAGTGLAPLVDPLTGKPQAEQDALDKKAKEEEEAKEKGGAASKIPVLGGLMGGKK